MKDTSPPSSARVTSFDFLRGVAILSVVSVHTSQTFPTGQGSIDPLLGLGRFGVQLFYLVSAMTMCFMWQRRAAEANRTRNFYIRRALRIAPLFWLAIPIYLGMNGTAQSYWAPEGIGFTQILLTALFLHGFWPDAINSVVPGGWSIAVEMTFYLFFPLIISTVGEKPRTYFILAFVMHFLNATLLAPATLAVLELVFSTHSATILKDFLFLYFPNQLPLFLLGCFIYFSMNEPFKRIARYALPTLAASYAAYALLNANRALFGWYTFGFLHIIILLTLIALLSQRYPLRLNVTFLRVLGQHSYSIYLSHFLVLSILSQALPWIGLPQSGTLAFPIGFVFTILLSYLVALALHYAVERPAHRLAEYLVSPR